MEKYMRLESDSIGTMEVPEDAYYGVQALRAKENFPITGTPVHPVFIKNLAKIKRAAAITNRKAGKLKPEISYAIESACNEVICGMFEKEFIVDGIQGGSNTKVTGLADIGKASGFALADGSVPVGKYTRQALVNAGMLEGADDVSTITTDEVSKALGGVEINECANVGAVTSAVAEESNEVGTVYYSDTYGLEDKLDILEVVPYDLTGDVIYPIAEVVNKEADDAEKAAAVDFIKFLVSDDAKAIFRKYYFDTNVEN